MNIYDQCLALPPTSRRVLAVWLLRTLSSTDQQVMQAAKEARKLNMKAKQPWVS